MWLVGSGITFGVAARLWAQTLPGNWDFWQWVNVSNAVLDGGDPYGLYGYNYPPPWLLTLTVFNALTPSETSFRLLISLLLIAADIGITVLLVRRGYTLAAVAFILSPVLIAISGQHQQVEGIAVFLALAAMTLFSKRESDRITSGDWGGALLLGLSLAYKPVFLLLPVWLLIRPGSLQRRLVHFVVPIAVFGAIFSSAFLAYPAGEVIQKVLGHSGTNNSPFINAFVPGQLAPWVIDHGGGKIAFLLILLATAVLFRRLAPFEMALAYTLTALTFSWAVANQYFATPMAAVAIYLNIGFLLWFLIVVLYLGGTHDILNVWLLRDIQPHVVLEWQQVMQDVFPWMFMGWVIYVFATRSKSRLMQPNAVRSSNSKGS